MNNLLYKLINYLLISLNIKMAYGDALSFMKSLFSYRGILDLYKNNNDLFLSLFIRNSRFSTVFYPVDIFSLRGIISFKEIVSSNKMLLFSNSLCKEFEKEYKVLLILNLNSYNESEYEKIGNIIRFKNNKISIRDKVSGILVFDSESLSLCEQIIEEENPSINIYFNDYSNIDNIKYAMKNDLNENWIIDIPSLNINNRICISESAESALNEVLSKEWLDKKNKYENPVRYTVDFWKNSLGIDKVAFKKNNYFKKANMNLGDDIKDYDEYETPNVLEKEKEIKRVSVNPTFGTIDVGDHITNRNTLNPLIPKVNGKIVKKRQNIVWVKFENNDRVFVMDLNSSDFITNYQKVLY